MAENQKEQEEKTEKKSKAAAPGAPMWMVTYSDLVTLLLTFFVLLLSMASMDPVKFNSATNSIKDAFGMHQDSAQIEFAIPVLPSPPITRFLPINPEQTSKLYNRVKAQIDFLKLGKDVEAIKKDSDTIILRINDSILFPKGQAKVNPRAYPTLRKIADIIRPLPASVRIEGHTDDTPLGLTETGNWDLSVERSVSVLRFLKQGSLLPLDRLAAIGYGPDKPVTPNVDEDSRSLNRRVDFVLKLRNPDRKTDRESQSPDIPL